MSDQNVWWTEYAIVQGKVDRIGEFKFKIKGWAATLVAASLFPYLASDMDAAVGLAMLPVLALFYFLDVQQEMLAHAFSIRCVVLEKRMPPSMRMEISAVSASVKRTSLAQILRKRFRKKRSKLIKWLCGPWVLGGPVIFYLILSGMVIGAVVLKPAAAVVAAVERCENG